MKYLIRLVAFLISPSITVADFITGANLANEGKFEEANKEFQKGIEKGEPKSFFGLGSAYYFGDGVKIDHKRAFELFEQGSRRGNGESSFILAMMYIKGEYVQKSTDNYLKYIKLAASACVPQAQHELGYLLMDGKLLEKNYFEAAAWFMTAFWIDGNGDIPLSYLLNNLSSEDRSRVIGRQKEIIANGKCETQRY